jgi:uncharacterized protein YoxC
VINPIFWLVLSFVLVSISLTAVLVVLVPAVRELSRAARSVEKLCDTLNRDLPPTLESIRLTSTEIAHLTDDVNEGVQHAGRVAQQVDQSVVNAKVQAKRATITTRSLMAGIGAALQTLTQPEKKRDRRAASQRYATRRLSSQSPKIQPDNSARKLRSHASQTSEATTLSALPSPQKAPKKPLHPSEQTEIPQSPPTAYNESSDI